MEVITFTTTEFTDKVIKKVNPCHKCNGQGKIAAYKYIDNGRCFKCGGTGKGLIETEVVENTTHSVKNAVILEENDNFDDVFAKWQTHNTPESFNLHDWFETNWFE